MSHPLNPAFEKDRPKPIEVKVMDNKIETRSGEIVEVINGTLMCKNNRINLFTIADWLAAHDREFTATVTIRVGDRVQVDMPETEPTHRMESLLQQFEYQ